MHRRNALLSVYSKDGIDTFAKGLCDLGWTMFSSGGTAKFLRAANVEVTDVSSLVGGEAILGHKVVTLSREVHAGLLAYDTPEDLAELERLRIPWLDLVCVDLYPLEEAIRTRGENPDAIREMTDIGGPTMLRSAAKGRRIVIADPSDRAMVLGLLQINGNLSTRQREKLAAKAEQIVGEYCLTSAQYLSCQLKRQAQ
jgi:phosphoribosylaminoimidazolecarboxamide formyltransferase / IMP cyclohydrolase